MDELPRLYSEEESPETPKRSKLAIGLLVLVLLMLPVGVFITLKSNNDLRSNASTEEIKPDAQTGIQLVSPSSSVSNQSIFPVDVVIRSDQQSTNFFSSHINFPAEKLEVISIATSPVDLNDQTKEYIGGHWVDSSFSNEQGIINLAAGNTPGIKGNNLPEQKKYVLATIFFKARSAGQADITLQPGSMILGTEGNNNLLSVSKSLQVQISDSVGDFADKSYESMAAVFIKPRESSSGASLALLSPNGGEVFSYYKPINIKWQAPVPSTPPKNSRGQTSAPAKETTISLLMNEQFLGQLTQVPETATEYSWDPAKTLPLDYIKSENSFKIELQTEVAGVKRTIASEGPFSVLSGNITARQLTDAELGPDRTDLNGDGSTDFRDISFLLSQYSKPVTVNNKKSDINNDLDINDIDLWFISKALKL